MCQVCWKWIPCQHYQAKQVWCISRVPGGCIHCTGWAWLRTKTVLIYGFDVFLQLRCVTKIWGFQGLSPSDFTRSNMALIIFQCTLLFVWQRYLKGLFTCTNKGSSIEISRVPIFSPQRRYGLVLLWRMPFLASVIWTCLTGWEKDKVYSK